MGVAIAEAALDRGARVTLIAANVEVAAARRAPTVVRVESTADLRAALLRAIARRRRLGRVRCPGHGRRGRRLPAGRAPPTTSSTRGDGADAASSSRRPTCWPRSPASSAASTATASRRVGRSRPRPILVGFAAETGSLERAADKLRRKGVDLLVANDVAEPGSGFGTDTNRVTILAADGSRDDLPLQSQARGGRRAARPRGRARWTSATPPRRLVARPSPRGSQHERHDRHRRAA